MSKASPLHGMLAPARPTSLKSMISERIDDASSLLADAAAMGMNGVQGTWVVGKRRVP